MPRWNRREKPDYRHLRDMGPEAALLGAIRSPTYGEAHDNRLLAGFQARLTAMWGDRDVLAMGELVPVHEDLRARDPTFFGYGRGWVGALLHDIVGNLVGWGLRLGILEEVAVDGARAFRMVRRDPLFERMGDGRWRRLDAEGVRAKSARGAGQREAARVRHADAVADRARELVGELADLGAPVPEWWITNYPEQFGRFDGLDLRVANARPTFEEAHRGMHLADQKRWLKALASHLGTVKSEQAEDRYRGRLPRYDQAEPAALPAEDAEALGSLTLD